MRPSSRPAVRIVCPDVSINAMGRALLLGDLLCDRYEVKVIGIQRRETIWPPCAGHELLVEGFPVRHPLDYVDAASWLEAQVAGAKVIVSKPRVTSLGLALAAGCRLEDILLDIDDWETGLMLPLDWPNGWYRPSRLLPLASGFNSPAAHYSMEAVARRAPHVVVSNSWLQRRFGGEVLYHVRDAGAFSVDADDVARFRERHQLGEKVWIAFVGTPRAHKGIVDLTEAVASLPEHVGLLVGGIDQDDALGRSLLEASQQRLGAARLRALPPFPTAELPVVLASIDIVCLPSRASPAARGQIPAKVFDAMAAGKPVVATAVNDLPLLLDSCGLVVPPAQPEALREALRGLVEDPERRARLGAAAKRAHAERYDYRAGRAILQGALLRVGTGAS